MKRSVGRLIKQIALRCGIEEENDSLASFLANNPSLDSVFLPNEIVSSIDQNFIKPIDKLKSEVLNPVDEKILNSINDLIVSGTLTIATAETIIKDRSSYKRLDKVLSLLNKLNLKKQSANG